MSEPNLIEPGSVELNHVVLFNANGEGVNLTLNVASLSIYENIMAPFITGELVISDAIDLTGFMPLKGEETLVLSLQTPGFDDDFFKRVNTYHVYKMESKINAAMKQEVLILKFVSIEAMIDVNTRISKTYKGKVSDSVESFITSSLGLNTKKPALVEPTVNYEMHTSNFWTPTQNIYYLSGRALNVKNNPSFLFFENKDGFVFSSLDVLNSTSPIMVFLKDQYQRDPTKERNFLAEYARVLDMETTDHYDYFERIRNGQYGSATYFFDIETKKLHYIERDAKTSFDSKLLNQKRPFEDYQDLPAKPIANLRTEVQHRSIHNGSPLLPIDTGMKRAALLTQEQFFKTNIQVFGRFDYTVGRTVYLQVYKNKQTLTSDTETDVIDTIMTGKYLITSIAHHITRKKHVCNIELSKDSISVL